MTGTASQISVTAADITRHQDLGDIIGSVPGWNGLRTRQPLAAPYWLVSALPIRPVTRPAGRLRWPQTGVSQGKSASLSALYGQKRT